ncbi:MAG: tRNA-dihydrouridine synthase [Candidatus Staskawiczbacteria bacterium]|jgi:nifR3 family TIM-barrel protein
MELGFWKKLKKPIMVMAPMSGVTDEAFRLMLLKYGRPNVFWTEFASAEGLLHPRGRKFCMKVLEFSRKEKPIVAQLFGSDPLCFEKSACLMQELGFDGIDINMGCPDRAIENKGAGAALIKSPSLAREIIRATKRGALRGAQGKQVSMPVSVKTRIGYNKNQIKEWIPEILKEQPAVLTVHFRTRNDTYATSANWELAKEILKLRDKYSPETLIIGNGDVKSLKQAKKMAKDLNLDGIMIGRALIGDPWFFAPRSLGEVGFPSVKERLKAIIEHAEIFDKLHKDEKVINGHYKRFESLKKHFHAYTKGFYGAKDLRDQLMKVKNTKEARKVIKNFQKKSSTTDGI